MAAMERAGRRFRREGEAVVEEERFEGAPLFGKLGRERVRLISEPFLLHACRLPIRYSWRDGTRPGPHSQEDHTIRTTLVYHRNLRLLTG